jgi:hypothetical protein
MWNKFRQSIWFDLLALTIVLGLAYLIHVTKFTYYRDDWYYMFDGHSAGPSVFQVMFNSDRPGRGPFFGLYFVLFGINPLPYAVGTFLWRWLSALGAYWLFRILWSKNSENSFFAALLFGLFPGYLWWVAGVEYQPMIASLGLQVFSIVFSLMVIKSTKRWQKILYGVLSVLTGLEYLVLVDYAIGMEIFRWLCIYLLVNREAVQASFFSKLKNMFWAGAFNLSTLLVYLIWRLFIFQNVRKATDLGLQIGQLFASPVNTSLAWGTSLLQSAMNILLGAWIEPFSRNFFGLRMQSMAIGLAIGIVAAIIALSKAIKPKVESSSDLADDSFQKEAILLGLAGVVIGVLPVVVVNRTVVFERFSHYALPTSLAGALFIAGLVSLISSKNLRLAALFSLVAVAVMTHFAVATNAINEEKAIQQFWWQVNWRAPGIKKGTTLVVNYPGIEYGEDYETVSGPANFIYYPEKTKTTPVNYTISSISMTSESIKTVLVGKLGVEREVRSHAFIVDYGNVLVVSQPAANACVHLMDSRWPDLSESERDAIMLVASQSKNENVLIDPQPQFMPKEIFGAEPEHAWCYYYQKAALARQQGQWDEIIKIDEKTSKLDLRPNDQIELMPFLQAYAFVGNEKQVKQLSTRVNTVPYYKVQACQALRAMDKSGYALSPTMRDFVDKTFCGVK